MNNLRYCFSLFVAKFSYLLLRISGSEASSLPGLLAERVYPDFIKKSIGAYQGKVIIVTGTNGKTTTSKIITSLLLSQRKIVITNESGSNFTRGIITTLATKSSFLGKLNADFIVLEVDEAYSPSLAEAINPDVMVALNVHRDQLDRYGEIATTAQYITEAAAYCKQVVVNSTDRNLVQNTTKHKHNIYYFGASTDVIDMISSEENLLGGEHKKTGKHINNDVVITTYNYNEISNFVQFSIQIEGVTYDVGWNIPGAHNAMNAAASILAVIRLIPNTDIMALVRSLEQIQPVSGRGEVITVADSQITITLAKNPSGFNQNLQTYENSKYDAVLIIINDLIADGTDISWLWDVNLGPLSKMNTKIFIGGTRAYDMALCLQYQKTDSAVLEGDNIDKQLRYLFKNHNFKNILLIANYTAMRVSRKSLVDMVKEVKTK